MAFVPIESALVEHFAVRVLPLPASATAVQPASAVPFFLNTTVPVGDDPVTVAVNVTVAPLAAGFTDDDSAVVVVTRLGGATPVELTCTDTPVALADSTLIVVPYCGSLNVLPTVS